MSSLDDEMRKLRNSRDQQASTRQAWEQTRFTTSEQRFVVAAPLAHPAIVDFLARARRRGMENYVLAACPDGLVRMTRFATISEAIDEYQAPGEVHYRPYMNGDNGRPTLWSDRRRVSKAVRYSQRLNRADAERLSEHYGWHLTLVPERYDHDEKGIELFEDARWATGRKTLFSVSLSEIEQRLVPALAAALISIEDRRL